MENESHLYIITNNINNKLYFGITTQNPPEKRWAGHKTVARRNVRNTPLYNAINKYGECNFTFKVIESSNDLDYIANKEREMISAFNTQNIEFGYNLADGGEINRGFNIPLDVRKNRSKNMMGSKNHFYGKKHSNESIEKISKAKVGFKMSKDSIEKMKGRTSPMKGLTGINNPLFGTHRDDCVKNKILENMPHRKCVYMCNVDGDVIVKFRSKKEAGRWLINNNKSSSKNDRSIASTITRAIKLSSVAYGYIWREYLEGQSTIENTFNNGSE